MKLNKPQRHSLIVKGNHQKILDDDPGLANTTGDRDLKTCAGKWHGNKCYFGLHYDLHAGVKDAKLGTRCGLAKLVPMLKLANPDFVQADCKGHPGYTSWFTKTPAGSTAPLLKKDALKQWRAATKKLGLPLHCHYSGVWDIAAGTKYPEWCVVGPEAPPAGAPFGQNAGVPLGEVMCPRSPYLEQLLIPQMIELIDRYSVDGFWVDGDLWAVAPCYCGKCTAAFASQTGITAPPKAAIEKNWAAWWNFTRQSFDAYVTRYCEAVHSHRPGVLVCSNWLQTFKNPGEPKVPTDWISGDNSHVWGMDGSRCEARFLSTRGKPWDIMLWAFYKSHDMGDETSPWTFKPAQMLMQEAAVLLSFGGQVQIYENSGVRDGRLVPWRQNRLREVGRFVKARRSTCQDTQTIPQIAVLHSEIHLFATPTGPSLQWGVDASPVQGAVYALLENSFGVDILDEWALATRATEFPVIVVPEQDLMSDAMIDTLKAYVQAGGRLLVTGPELLERFGAAFLGVKAGKLVAEATYHVPAGEGSVPVYSKPWRLIAPRAAKSLGRLGTLPLLKDGLLPNPAATIHRVGKGAVAYIPAKVCRDFEKNRYPLTRQFIGMIVRDLAGNLDIIVSAPVAIDVVLRQRSGEKIVHLVNRSSGIPNQKNNGAIDQIPDVGPITITMRSQQRPKSVTVVLDDHPIIWKYAAGKLTINLKRVTIHAAIIIR